MRFWHAPYRLVCLWCQGKIRAAVGCTHRVWARAPGIIGVGAQLWRGAHPQGGHGRKWTLAACAVVG